MVDDELVNQMLLASSLKQDGYEVATASDGQEALRLLRARPYDVVLLDILMPEMDGYQVLERMQADETLRVLPVIVISALDDMQSVVRCIEMGATDYLPKPFNPVLLRARIDASLAAKRLRDQERAYLQAVKRELELGRQIQADFLPETLPQPPGWEISARFQPALEVSGDFYDAFVLADGRVALVIADVCGKGVGAALFTALVRSLIRFFAEQVNPCVGDVFDVVSLANNYIARHHGRRGMMFATLFFGVLDTTSGALSYVNAGHPSPVVTGPSGVRDLSSRSNPALGLFPDLEFVRHEARIEPGEILLAYTDGVTEAYSAEREAFSKSRLLAALQPIPPTAAALLEGVEERLRAHVAGEEPSDDITMLAVRRA